MSMYINKGFTLVETLVAITILLLVIIGPMTIAQKGIQNAYFATEQAAAVFLAQEAIEAVRELRDTEALNEFYGGSNSNGDTTDWHPACSGGCAYTGTEFVGCYQDGGNGCELNVDNSGRYTHETISTSPSPFTRIVTVTPEGTGGQNAKAIVTVSWESNVFGGSIREVILQTWIYNHYQRYGN